jgi:hypothetical protein
LTALYPESAGVAFTKVAFDQQRPAVNANIHHNHITGFWFGMRLQALEGGTVEQNHCQKNVQGLSLRGVKGLSMAHNVTNDSGLDPHNPDGTVALRAAGIVLQNVVSSNIAHNESSGNARGFLIKADDPSLFTM